MGWGSPQSSDTKNTTHHSQTSHKSSEAAIPRARATFGQPQPDGWAPTLGCRHLSLVELLEALLVGLAVVVDLRLRGRVELDVADLAEGERLVLLLPFHALFGLAWRAAGCLHQPDPALRAVRWAQGSLHACGRKDRPAVRTEGPGEAGKPSTGPMAEGCSGCWVWRETEQKQQRWHLCKESH